MVLALEDLDEIAQSPDYAQDFDQIEKIVVRSHANMVNQHMEKHPKTVMQGQYSCPFTIGAYMEGAYYNPTTYLDNEIIHNPDILRWVLEKYKTR